MSTTPRSHSNRRTRTPRSTVSFQDAVRAALAANDATFRASFPSDLVEVAERGRRLTAQQIADEFYGGHVSVDWVNDHVPYRLRVSHRVVLWWEYDVLAHLREERERSERRKPQYNRRPRSSTERRGTSEAA